MRVLTDGQWAVLAPLIEECRPKGKTKHHDLRRTIEAIIWRQQNGAKWRAIPAELGPWWRAAQTFIRWARLGVWERLLDAAQARGVALGMTFLDGTNIRAHQKAAGAARKGDLQQSEMHVRHLADLVAVMAKACVIADGSGRALAFALAPGQAHELPLGPVLLECLPAVPGWVVGDRGHGSHGFRERIWDSASRPAIPSKRNEAAVACPAWVYNNRNMVERLWGRLKEWRAVATRYDKTARSFMGVLCLAAAWDWIKS